MRTRIAERRSIYAGAWIVRARRRRGKAGIDTNKANALW